MLFLTKLRFSLGKFHVCEKTIFPLDNRSHGNFANDTDCLLSANKFDLKYYYYKVSCYAY